MLELPKRSWLSWCQGIAAVAFLVCAGACTFSLFSGGTPGKPAIPGDQPAASTPPPTSLWTDPLVIAAIGNAGIVIASSWANQRAIINDRKKRLARGEYVEVPSK